MSVGATNPLRQQMINMMYLVLTALLALNVSAEILKAFETVTKSMAKAIESIDVRNKNTMKEFEKLYQATPNAVRLYYDKAKQANKIADDFYDFVENLKKNVITEGGGIDPETGTVVNQADFEGPTRIMVNEKNGDKLLLKINETRKKFIDLMKDMPSFNLDEFMPKITLLEEKGEKGEGWANKYFHMVPNIACITLFTKWQTDARNTQSNIINELLSSIGKEDFKVSNLIPVVNVTSGKSAVSVGEKYEAEILLAAYDKSQQPEIFLGGNKLDVKDGVATYTGNTGAQGSFDISGEIVVKNKSTGEAKKYPYRLAYDVFNAPAIVSPTKMMTFYAALDNPISVSVPGYKPSDIVASVSAGATIKPDKNAGDYLVFISPNNFPREVTVNVSVKSSEGGMRSIGKGTVFRIRQVPKPIAAFGAKEGGEISAGEIKLVNFVTARLYDFPFEGIKYTVKKYNFVYAPRRGQVVVLEGKSSALTPEMKSALNNPGKGDKIFISEIWTSFPGDKDKMLQSAVSLTVK